MARLARLGVCVLALSVAGITAAVGLAAPVEEKQVHIGHRAGGGYLGVQLEDVGQEDLARLKLEDERGALVRDVVESGPAAKAGLKQGDVILRYHGQVVLSAAQLARLVAETPVGRSVPIELSRDGAAQKLSVTLSERKGRSWMKGMPEMKGVPDLDLNLPEPPEAPEAPEAPEPPSGWMGKLLGRDWGRGFEFGSGGPRKLGIAYQEISGQLARHFKVSGEAGVLVTDVDEDGPAAKAGVKAGDVVLVFDGKEIRAGDDLRRAVHDAEAGREVALKVQREGRPVDLSVTLADRERERERRRGAGI